MSVSTAKPMRVAVVAGEHSGDHLGAALINALQELAKQGGAAPLEFVGVGGEEMAAAGMVSLFPLSDVAVMGPLAIAARLPKLVRRVYQAVDHIVQSEPDILVIIDSPEFTHPIAKRIRARVPNIPIINYVSPSVWAWRPGRAVKMRGYIDHVLGLLPFEPKAHRELGGPPCTYVGHPLAEKIQEMRNISTESLEQQLQLRPGKPVMAVLPGSRASEVRRLMPVFTATLNRLMAEGADFEAIIPALPHVRPLIDAELRKTGVPVYIVEGRNAKLQAFKLATCALAASGTVSLELAVMQTPMAIAYKVDVVAARLRPFISAQSCVLPNLVLGQNVVPEFLQQDCTVEKLTAAMKPLLGRSTEYNAQMIGFDHVEDRLRLPNDMTPSTAAAMIVAHYLTTGRPRDAAQEQETPPAPVKRTA